MLDAGCTCLRDNGIDAPEVRMPEIILRLENCRFHEFTIVTKRRTYRNLLQVRLPVVPDFRQPNNQSDGNLAQVVLRLAGQGPAGRIAANVERL